MSLVEEEADETERTGLNDLTNSSTLLTNL
jgi:hypothetical protein